MTKHRKTVGLVTIAAWFGASVASDHQDTPEVELHPRLPEASAFRDPGFDFLAGINTLAIVVELPAAMLLGANAGAPDPAIGIWATTSH
jgi:hypothetical protein